MLKIKDNVDLKELEKLGFEKRNEFGLSKEIENCSRFDFYISIDARDREIFGMWTQSSSIKADSFKNFKERLLFGNPEKEDELDKIIQNLIQAGLAEKVSD